MTEDEAKTKWCPFARVAWKTDPAYNRAQGFAPDKIIKTACIASACMAWRDLFEAALDGEEAARLMNLGEPMGIVRLRKAGGYCGLAAKP